MAKTIVTFSDGRRTKREEGGRNIKGAPQHARPVEPAPTGRDLFKYLPSFFACGKNTKASPITKYSNKWWSRCKGWSARPMLPPTDGCGEPLFCGSDNMGDFFEYKASRAHIDCRAGSTSKPCQSDFSTAFKYTCRDLNLPFHVLFFTLIMSITRKPTLRYVA